MFYLLVKEFLKCFQDLLIGKKLRMYFKLSSKLPIILFLENNQNNQFSASKSKNLFFKFPQKNNLKIQIIKYLSVNINLKKILKLI
jgi:hypothetical protein